VVHESVRAGVPKILARKTEHGGGGPIYEDALTLQVETIDALPGGFEKQLEPFARFVGFFTLLAVGYCANLFLVGIEQWLGGNQYAGCRINFLKRSLAKCAEQRVVIWKLRFAEQGAGGCIRNDNCPFGVTGHDGGAGAFQNGC
jgi:hypothetical protein